MKKPSPREAARHRRRDHKKRKAHLKAKRTAAQQAAASRPTRHQPTPAPAGMRPLMAAAAVMAAMTKGQPNDQTQ